MDVIVLLFKISLSIFLSGLIGLEREIRQRGAGLRTHILVGVGSTLIVLTSFHLFDIYNTSTPIDPTRMIAGIITGVGFLCAGTIMQAQSRVMGLTTAAALWIVSCIGIAVGAGHYLAATVVAVVVFIVLISMRPFEYKLAKKLKDYDSKHYNQEGE